MTPLWIYALCRPGRVLAVLAGCAVGGWLVVRMIDDPNSWLSRRFDAAIEAGFEGHLTTIAGDES